MATCALVAATDFNADYFQQADEAGLFDEVYAVDAGFAHLQSIGRVPDVAIGDFDSLGYVPTAKRVSRHPVHKDKTDLELALERAQASRFASVVVFGAIGGRLDHTLCNLQLLAKFAEAGMDVTAIAPDCAVHVVVGPDSYELPLLDSGTVSVVAATPVAHGVIERGMEYALSGEDLTARTSRGISNELAGEPAAVAVEEGTLLVFHPLA